MGQYSSIEWTDATWNPTTGCTKVSKGCDNCYAFSLAHGRLAEIYSKQLPVLPTQANLRDPFALRLWPERLGDPAKLKGSRVVFVNSMSDLFHVEIPEEFLLEVFKVMLEVDRHVYQILTKRPARAARFFAAHPEILDERGLLPEHIWIGASIENQENAYRERHLGTVPARIRFLSCEPLLGPVDLTLQDIHWVIVGGESGIGYRRMEEEWAVQIRDRCAQEGVPFFFKQWGGRTPKAGGRLLRGEEHNRMPPRPNELVLL